MPILLPKTDALLPEPPIFLAGPIKGGGDWQTTAISLIFAKKPDAVIVCPRLYKPEHPLYQQRIEGEEGMFKHQTLWERKYIDNALYSGCVLFWLPCGSSSEPRDDGSPYARDTYGELGELRGRKMGYRSLRVVIGAELDFPGLKQIKLNYVDAFQGFPFYETLEATVDAALALY